jgi:hypothetical protein
MPRMRLLLACAAALAAAAAGSAAADGPVRATLTTSSTRAIVGVPWAYTIAVRGIADGPVDARVKLQVLRGHRVVRCWTGLALVPCSSAGSATWIAFRGSRRGAIVWPARLAGSRLTFHVLVAAGTRSLSLDAPVNVRGGP